MLSARRRVFGSEFRFLREVDPLIMPYFGEDIPGLLVLRRPLRVYLLVLGDENTISDPIGFDFEMLIGRVDSKIVWKS